jgi:hypothetical protein
MLYNVHYSYRYIWFDREAAVDSDGTSVVDIGDVPWQYSRLQELLREMLLIASSM